MDDIEKCTKSGILSLKNNFHKKSRFKDGLTPHCKLCQKIYRKRFYNEHYNLEIIKRRN